MKLADIFAPLDAGARGVVRRPCVIAEAGVNHEGSLDLAKRLIAEAAEGGADAIKFQTYKAHTLASRHSPSYWDRSKEPTASQFELFQKYDRFWKAEYELLKRACDEAGIEFLSTPFDVESAKFLNDLMDVVKISSSDITNVPFLRELCGYGKPILLSTGASWPWEVERAVGEVRAAGNPLCLLHCVLNYPTLDANANLGMIVDLARRYPGVPIGYSDHTLPADLEVLITATLLGSVVLEKHFTHDKSLPGNDHYHAMDRADLKRLQARFDRTFELLGSFDKAPLPSEAPARANARRSLVAAVDVPAGTVLTARHLTWKRPAHGISPMHYDQVLGMRAAVDLHEDDVLLWEMIRA